MGDFVDLITGRFIVFRGLSRFSRFGVRVRDSIYIEPLN